MVKYNETENDNNEQWSNDNGKQWPMTNDNDQWWY